MDGWTIVGIIITIIFVLGIFAFIAYAVYTNLNLNSCTSNTNCTSDKFCFKGSCIPKCINDSSCINGQICESETGKCIEGYYLTITINNTKYYLYADNNLYLQKTKPSYFYKSKINTLFTGNMNIQYYMRPYGAGSFYNSKIDNAQPDIYLKFNDKEEYYLSVNNSACRSVGSSINPMYIYGGYDTFRCIVNVSDPNFINYSFIKEYYLSQ